ncbi:HSPBP1 [Cordylochernes scorpioides]|uniref:HSPBP1 n=1 Tax=Cordylochernes scorpioides TaxID=51811 RepID=A0ABY6LGD1_9ARAC|nr:HSPBP1 [Cordylochernes scorpioides]
MIRLLQPQNKIVLEPCLSMATTSMVKEMQKSLEEIRTALQSSHHLEDTNLYVLEVNLEKLVDITGSIDNAMEVQAPLSMSVYTNKEGGFVLTLWCPDFEKIGGFSQLLPLLQVESPVVRSQAAELVAVLCQNNPYCQQAALREKLLPKLLQLVDSDPDDTVSVKALYAVSCLARQSPILQEEFDKLDGFSYVLRAMQRTQIPKLRTKSAFLLSSLCHQNPAFRDTLYRMGLVEQLAALLRSDHDLSHEHLLSLLLAMARDHAPSRQACQRPELQLSSLLRERLTSLGGKEEYREESEYCRQILQLCFNSQDDLER